MIAEKRLSKACVYYEMFMERAYGSLVKQKPVLQESGMRNLIMAEKEISDTYESIAHFEELLFRIKKHIKEALENYICSAKVAFIINELKETKSQVIWAVSSEELIRIIFKIMDLTDTMSVAMSK